MIKIIKYVFLIILFLIIPLCFVYKTCKINDQREANMKNLYLSILNAPVLVSDEKTFTNTPTIEQKMQLIEKMGEMQNYSLSMLNTIKKTGNEQDVYYGRVLNIYYNYNEYANRLQNESKIDKYTSMEYLNKIAKSYDISPEKYKKNTQIKNTIIGSIVIIYLLILTLVYAFLIKRKMSKI